MRRAGSSVGHGETAGPARIRMARGWGVAWLLAALLTGPLTAKKKASTPSTAPLDQYVAEAAARSAEAPAPTAGAIWSPVSRLADGARDLRASQVDDVVTIVVADSASAVAKGTTKTQRTSSTKHSVSSLAGVKSTTGALANLATTSGDTQLAGDGTTSRQTTLSTTLTARVSRVLPNGNLVLEGSKTVQVNSEHQTITVRGVIRPADLAAGNTVASNSLGQLEIRVNGKGVVGDAVRRPFILYRLLLGLLPF
jgi:flagellar L-ring protein FlgH